MTSRREATIAIGTVLALFSVVLTVGPFARPQAQACPPGCSEQETCRVGPNGMECTTTCVCPPGETPPADQDPTTPVPWTPPPTATPLPDNMQLVCWAANCPPGEHRLTRFHFDPFGALLSTTYLEGCCGPSCPCEVPSAPPDEPITIPGGGVIGSEWGAQVELQLPVWTADRRPYPRGMVNVPNVIWAEEIPPARAWSSRVDPGGSHCDCRSTGTCDDDPPPVGTMCDFQLGLKTEPGVEAPVWACEESEGGPGYEVRCSWRYSSADKPYIGKGLHCEDLPAFRVTASLPYWWSIGRQWYEWKEVGQDCGCAHVPGWGTAACDLTGDGHADEDTRWMCEPVYGWVHEGPNWEMLDLRHYEWPTPYMQNDRVQLVPWRDCGSHPVGVLPIPVIEVQGVISNPKD